MGQQRAAPPPKRRRGSRRCFGRPRRDRRGDGAHAAPRTPRRGCPVLGPLSGTARGTFAVCARIQSAAPCGPAVVRAPVAAGRPPPLRLLGPRPGGSVCVPGGACSRASGGPAAKGPPRRRRPSGAAAALRALPLLPPRGGRRGRLGGPPLRARPAAVPRSPRRVPAHRAAAPRRGEFRPAPRGSFLFGACCAYA